MSALYNVEFRRKSDGAYAGVYVSSADATSLKKVAVAKAYRKARAKAKVKLAKELPRLGFAGTKVRDFTVVSCRCVG